MPKRFILAGLLAFASAPIASAADTGVRYDQVHAGAYAIVAEVWARPGSEDALRAATLPLVGLVRGDPKNLVYFLQEDREAPGRFVFYEVFASEADFDAHNATPYVKAWLDGLPRLAQGGVKVRRLEVLGGER